MPQFGQQVSLHQPNAETPDKRASRLDVAAPDPNPNTVPMPERAKLGHNTRGARWIHNTVQNESGACQYSLWLWDEVSELWCLDKRLGTDGIVDATDGPDLPCRDIVEIAGTSRVYLQFVAASGAHNAWLSGVSEGQ